MTPAGDASAGFATFSNAARGNTVHLQVSGSRAPPPLPLPLTTTATPAAARRPSPAPSSSPLPLLSLSRSHLPVFMVSACQKCRRVKNVAVVSTPFPFRPPAVLQNGKNFKIPGTQDPLLAKKGKKATSGFGAYAKSRSTEALDELGEVE